MTLYVIYTMYVTYNNIQKYSNIKETFELNFTSLEQKGYIATQFSSS